LLQAWPGRGFWQGNLRGSASGTVTAMVRQMAQTPQPHLLSSWVSAFGTFDSAHGWAVNLFVVVTLACIGAALLTARPRVVGWAVGAAIVLGLADWVLVQDLGFMGGVGTDPNSMLPLAFILLAGYLAISRAPAVTAGVDATAARAAVSVAGADVTSPVQPTTLGSRPWDRLAADPTYAFRSIAALGAIGVALVGAVPMAVATTNPHADPILAEAIDGTPNATDSPAPAFNLVDQHGQAVSLAALRGRAVALTFLDPVCTSDCPIIAQEFREAEGILGPAGRRIELVAINANPRYTTTAYLLAFDHQENLQDVPNWLYLTGSLPQLEHVWGAFGVQVGYEPGGGMIAHSHIPYVVDSRGYTRFVLDTDPGPATEATRSSFAATLARALQSALHPPTSR